MAAGKPSPVSASEAAVSSSSSPSQIKRFLGLVVPCFLISQGLAYASTLPHIKDYRIQKIAVFTIIVQWVVFFGHASGLVFGNERTERFYDFTGSLTFLLSSAWSAGQLDFVLVPMGVRAGTTLAQNAARSPRQQILTVFVQLWAARLGLFLFSRIHQHGGIDSRFTAIKPSILRFFGAWTLQGVWVFITAMPVFALNQAPDLTPLKVVDFVGMAMWACGFLFEILADTQKTAFRANPKNKDKYITSGVWSLSRHPNYFGEMLLWAGVALSATNALPAWSAAYFACWVSPIFVFSLLTFVSGIPMLEKATEEKFGHLKEYQKFKATTPVLVPFLGRRGNAPF